MHQAGAVESFAFLDDFVAELVRKYVCAGDPYNMCVVSLLQVVVIEGVECNGPRLQARVCVSGALGFTLAKTEYNSLCR